MTTHFRPKSGRTKSGWAARDPTLEQRARPWNSALDGSKLEAVDVESGIELTEVQAESVAEICRAKAAEACIGAHRKPFCVLFENMQFVSRCKVACHERAPCLALAPRFVWISWLASWPPSAKRAVVAPRGRRTRLRNDEADAQQMSASSPPEQIA